MRNGFPFVSLLMVRRKCTREYKCVLALAPPISKRESQKTWKMVVLFFVGCLLEFLAMRIKYIDSTWHCVTYWSLLAFYYWLHWGLMVEPLFSHIFAIHGNNFLRDIQLWIKKFDSYHPNRIKNSSAKFSIFKLKMFNGIKNAQSNQPFQTYKLKLHQTNAMQRAWRRWKTCWMSSKCK